MLPDGSQSALGSSDPMDFSSPPRSAWSLGSPEMLPYCSQSHFGTILWFLFLPPSVRLEMLPDCSQSHFWTILRFPSPLGPPGLWGAQKCSQTAARTILGRYYGFLPPSVCLVPEEPRNAPRLQPEPFWDDTTVSFPPGSAWSLGSPEMLPDCSQSHFGTILRFPSPVGPPGPWGAQKCSQTNQYSKLLRINTSYLISHP